MTDRISKEKRSALMSRIRSKNTKPELLIFKHLRKRKISFRRHYRAPGTPDVAVPGKRRAVFMHGSYWHGWQYPRWAHKLPSKFWNDKIEATREKDRRHLRKLRAMGWRVLVVWEHDLRKDEAYTLGRIERFLTDASPLRPDVRKYLLNRKK